MIRVKAGAADPCESGPVKTTHPTTAIADPDEFDVRAIPCRVKHGQIFQRWHDLPVGSHFILVNDHDPIPLRYQFEAEFGGAFTWEYLEQGPEQFRVKIAKLKPVTLVPRTTLPSKPTAADASGLALVLDARGLEPPEPLIRILDTLESLPPGKTLRARTDREPCHLFGAARERGFRATSQGQADGSWITTLERV